MSAMANPYDQALLLVTATDYATAAREHLNNPNDSTRWRLDEAIKMLKWHALRAGGWSAEECDRYLYG